MADQLLLLLLLPAREVRRLMRERQVGGPLARKLLKLTKRSKLNHKLRPVLLSPPPVMLSEEAKMTKTKRQCCLRWVRTETGRPQTVDLIRQDRVKLSSNRPNGVNGQVARYDLQIERRG